MIQNELTPSTLWISHPWNAKRFAQLTLQVQERIVEWFSLTRNWWSMEGALMMVYHLFYTFSLSTTVGTALPSALTLREGSCSKL